MKIMKKGLAMLLVLLIVFSLMPSVSASPSASFITTTPTGYDSADDVAYKTYSVSGKTVIANWGARGETCVFLSEKVEDYYTGSYEWEILSTVAGGTTQSNASSSSLYKQLQSLMAGTHTFYTYYDGNKNVRDYYKYTDCVSNDVSKVALLYRGGLVSSAWDGGSTWNQEHVWPKSKLSTSQQIGDIMHLRPANPSENSSRGNTNYGQSSGYNPGKSVQGDCARMVLYMYVRWGATSTMWGSSGVMENLSTLLAWMEADPVDTWEMGRNDAVQSVTGVRNVFVDYPEYAWLLFGREVPEDMVTPSGEASENTSGGNGSTTPTEPTTPSQPPATEPPATEPPATEPPATEPPVTEPSVPPVDGLQAFKNTMGTLMANTAKGEAKFNLIAQAVDQYNALTDAEKESVAGLYERLKTEISKYNDDVLSVNCDAGDANIFIVGSAVAVTTLSVLGFGLLRKKFF